MLFTKQSLVVTGIAALASALPTSPLQVAPEGLVILEQFETNDGLFTW